MFEAWRQWYAAVGEDVPAVSKTGRRRVRRAADEITIMIAPFDLPLVLISLHPHRTFSVHLKYHFFPTFTWRKISRPTTNR